MNRGAAVWGLFAVASLSCSGVAPVRTERAEQPDEPPPSTESAPTTTAPTPPPSGPSSALVWRPCDDVPAEVTDDWECTLVTTPLDHHDPGGPQIKVALSRPAGLTGGQAPLLFNPGGPGGSGIEMMWYLTDLLPFDLLATHYPVGWDPRGVGRSVPAIDCGVLDGFELPDAERCIAGSGADLLAQVGAADSALDMESIRTALGVDRLDYVGYSYGTALGAVYAMAHPDGVGRFVLDGAIDPRAGDPEGPLAADGLPDYAADGLDVVIDRFHELCDATIECAAGPDSVTLREVLETTIRDLPTDHFDGDPAVLDRFDLEDLIAGSMSQTWTWGLVGDALRDAADGDASTLAALSSFLLDGYPVDQDEEPDALDAFGAAHHAIYCADFSRVDVRSCEGMPDADPLPVISAVDASAIADPIVVIGTSFDPSTPGRHAGELAAALGDAVAVTWEGVGHTAFPVSPCLDGLVVDFLADGAVPRDGRACPFVDGVAGDAGIGEYLFEFPADVVGPWITEVLVAEGVTADAAECASTALAGADHRIVTHLLLGVRSAAAVADRERVLEAC